MTDLSVADYADELVNSSTIKCSFRSYINHKRWKWPSINRIGCYRWDGRWSFKPGIQRKLFCAKTYLQAVS